MLHCLLLVEATFSLQQHKFDTRIVHFHRTDDDDEKAAVLKG